MTRITTVELLTVGANPITVTVTAEDGTTTKTYTVTVTRADAPPATPGPDHYPERTNRG